MDSLHRNRGFMVLEPMLAMSVLALLTLGIISAIILGQEQALRTYEHDHALYLASEGLEATRSIGDGSFAALAEGSYGLGVTDNAWILSGSEDITDGIYTRIITITDEGASVKSIESEVSWGSMESVSLETSVTDWKP